MKIRFFFLAIICSTFTSAQSYSINESLDRYFGGIPLRESFDMWIRYIDNHPYLGIDSSNKRGVYSSFKPGIKDHFPFDDSIPVKILFQKTIYFDTVNNIYTDSTNEVSIEAIFPSNRNGRNASAKVYNELRKALRQKYNSQYFETYSNGSGVIFSRGKNESFPNCILTAAYSEELVFYFVMITYTSPRKNERRKTH